jgi:ABC-2 type transport system permease protein
VNAFLGMFKFEFLMQLRRPAVWVTFCAVGAFLIVGLLTGGARVEIAGSLELAASAVRLLNLWLPIVFGILLADRLPRDARGRVGELFDALPTGNGTRLWGKYLGATSATLIPMVILYFVPAVRLAWLTRDAAILPLVLPAIALIVLPGLLFVGAFSIVCTAILPPPLHSILLIGYWFWGNVVPPNRMPTLNCTPLTPIGTYTTVGFFGMRNGVCEAFVINAPLAMLSILLLLAGAASALFAGQIYLNWRAARA